MMVVWENRVVSLGDEFAALNGFFALSSLPSAAGGFIPDGCGRGMARRDELLRFRELTVTPDSPQN
jgi:hypothetical protein